MRKGEKEKKRKKIFEVKKTIKRVIKKAAKKNPAVKKTAAGAVLPVRTEAPGIHIQKIKVEQAKFFTLPEPLKKDYPRELPTYYDKDRLTVLARDPNWLYVYWELKDSTRGSFREKLGEGFDSSKQVLRVYDVTNVEFNGKNANEFFDVEILFKANNWYVETGQPGRDFCVDLGLKLPNGEFVMMLRSNIAQSPPDRPSSISDEEWMIPHEVFARLYGMGFGLGQTSPAGKTWREGIQRGFSSAALTSPGIASMAGPVRFAKQKKFWLTVDCEFIVYGATRPDAKLTAQGKPVRLRQDGSFTLRYHLPDGKQIIRIKAVSVDNDVRVVTPIVERQTH